MNAFLNVALDLFVELAKNKIVTQKTVTAVMIASEENGEIAGVGVETLMETGKIDFLKNGPVLWVDCSDSQPCIGTGNLMTSILPTCLTSRIMQLVR